MGSLLRFCSNSKSVPSHNAAASLTGQSSAFWLGSRIVGSKLPNDIVWDIVSIDKNRDIAVGDITMRSIVGDIAIPSRS